MVPNGVLNLSGLAFPRFSAIIMLQPWQKEHQNSTTLSEGNTDGQWVVSKYKHDRIQVYDRCTHAVRMRIADSRQAVQWQPSGGIEKER